GFGDYSGGLEGMGMQRITPDQLSGVMAARMASATGTSDEMSSSSAGGYGTLLNTAGLTGESSSMSGSSFGAGLTNPFLSQSQGTSESQFLSLYGGQNQLQASAPQQYPLQANVRMPRVPSGPSAADLGLDRPMLARRPNPYADVPSLYDLYAQYSRRSP